MSDDARDQEVKFEDRGGAGAAAALIAAAIADARHASALLMSAAGVYGTAAAALVGLGIPFASVSAVVVGAVCGLMCWLGLSAAKVARKDER